MIKDLFDSIKRSMPMIAWRPNARAHVDVIAYLPWWNKFPSGTRR
jgi:hypothetical protein